MEEERIYRLKNGQELVLLANINRDGIRYLLLADEKTDEPEVGFEENGNLVLIDKQNPHFSELLQTLLKKLEDKTNM